MARARNIKPAIMANEDLAELAPLTRLLFTYLWMLADREGRLEDRPKRIATQALGYDHMADVGVMLDDLQGGGFIERYRAVGMACIQITNFLKHQTPHGTERDSSLPDKAGLFTVHTRGKNGYSTGVVSLVKRDLTVKSLSDNTLIPDTGFTDSPIPDTGIKIAPAAPVRPTVSASFETSAKPKPSSPGIAKPDEVTAQTWADWLQLRAKKRAPVTLTVLAEAIKESEKAGLPLERFLAVWCARGSQGLEATWLKSDERGTSQIKPTSKHADFETFDYHEGVNHDGSLV